MSERTLHRVYFDTFDYEQDGLGWNVIDLGPADSVALRFRHKHEAVEYCIAHDLKYNVEAISVQTVADALYEALATCRPWIDDFQQGDDALALYIAVCGEVQS